MHGCSCQAPSACGHAGGSCARVCWATQARRKGAVRARDARAGAWTGYLHIASQPSHCGQGLQHREKSGARVCCTPHSHCTRASRSKTTRESMANKKLVHVVPAGAAAHEETRGHCQVPAAHWTASAVPLSDNTTGATGTLPSFKSHWIPAEAAERCEHVCCRLCDEAAR